MRGTIASGNVASTIAMYGENLSTGTGGVGVMAASTTGIGASLQGGRAPLMLVPGAVSIANLTATGHQAGELYVTSEATCTRTPSANTRKFRYDRRATKPTTTQEAVAESTCVSHDGWAIVLNSIQRNSRNRTHWRRAESR